METILDIIEKTLKQSSKYITDDGKLLKAKIYSDTMTFDVDLIKLLLSNETIKKEFFVETEDIIVFDKQKFGWLINSKEFLPDSYTRFSNKIGLGGNDTFIFDDQNVVLNFPYKDSFLYGGQEKEDDVRNEVFFNEIIASKFITNMLEPKVFTNSKRYSNVEESVSKIYFDDNLILKGNNLIVLSSLLKRYENKIKLIYIDPPYNTGNDSFKYNDSFNHSTWLVFMKNRLEIAKKLLRSDGAIVVQCDDNEQAYLKVMMDEIFDNQFLNCIAVKMSEPSGVKMSHAGTRFPKLKEYLLIYTKKEFKGFEEIDKYASTELDHENNIFLENLSKEDSIKLSDLEDKDEITSQDLIDANNILNKVKKVSLSSKLNHLNLSNKTELEWMFENSYRIIKTAGSTSLAKIVRDLDNIPKQDIAAAKSSGGVLFYYITDFNREVKQPRLQVIFADKNLYKNPGDFWQDIKTTGAIANEGGVQLTNGKKPEKLLHRIIKMFTHKNDIVLDFFLGSGTTAAVAHKMNRQYIGVEQLNYDENDSVERLRNVINGDQTGISKEVLWEGGGSFVFAELKNDAQRIIEKIIHAESHNVDLIKTEIYEDFRIIPVITKEELEKLDTVFNELTLDEKKKALISLINKNKLYINYSDLDNQDYEFSDDEIEFNKLFYEEDL